MAIKKTTPVFCKSQSITDAGNGILKGVVILQAGRDKIGDNFDKKALDQLVILGNGQTQGVKARFGHPNMCDDALGTYVGRYKNFSTSANADGREVVIADLHLDDTSKKAPKGDLYNYVLEMAKKNNDMFGNSIVYRPATEEAVEEKDQDGNPKLVYYQRFESFVASDLVDSPAATTSLFKSDKDFAARATEYLDENPEIFEILNKSPDVFTEFFNKYLSYKKEKSAMKSLKSIVADAMKRVKDALGEKSYSATSADGASINISDEDGDGAPSQGDSVTDAEGKPMVSAAIKMQDGSTINTDVDGKITSIAPKEEATPAPDPVSSSEKSVEERLTELEKKFNAEVEAHKADNELAQKTIESLTKRLENIKSEGNPQGSSTQFRGKKPDDQMTEEEKKTAIAKRNPKLAKQLGIKIED